MEARGDTDVTIVRYTCVCGVMGVFVCALVSRVSKLVHCRIRTSIDTSTRGSYCSDEKVCGFQGRWMLNRLVWNELLSWRRRLLLRILMGLSWRVGRPSRRDLYVDAVYKHIDEHASVPADFTLGRACLVGAWHMRTEADVENAHSEIFEERKVNRSARRWYRNVM